MIGDGLDVAVMGAINVSPESFYAGSVAAGPDALLRMAASMVRDGAALLDVGGMSTAPYLSTAIGPAEEADRLGETIALLTARLDVPISADTSRAGPARAALEAGARVINDVSGLTADPEVARLVAGAGAGLIAMAAERGGDGGESPIETVLGLLEESLRLARDAGIASDRIAVDPGIGFFRRRGMPWHEWDCRVLADLDRLRDLGRAVCVGVSRKSFIAALADIAAQAGIAAPAGADDPADRLPGSLAATAIAVLGHAHLIRTHDVAETRQAVAVAAAVRRARDDARAAEVEP